MNPAVLAAIAALVAALGALFGSIIALIKLRDERSARQAAIAAEGERWLRELRKGVDEWQVQFLRDLVERRVGAYPPVFRSLAAVRDVAGANDGHLAHVRQHPEGLTRTADELLNHLYGEAGLLMSMSTRNQVHSARVACLQFQAGGMAMEDLVYAFYEARRLLRLDIQLADADSLVTALKEIAEERKAEGPKGLKRRSDSRAG